MKKTLYLLIPLSLIIIFLIVWGIPNGILNINENEEERIDTSLQEDDRNSSCSDGSGVVDGILTDSRDKQTYNTVEIGEQCWMSQNLNYDNGCSDVIWADDSRDDWCGCYDNNIDNCNEYGLLYKWTVAMNTSEAESSQGICPNGWHVPSDDEWKTLEIFLGMNEQDANKEGPERSSGNVKSKLTNTNYKDYSGFNALPGGMRVGDGDFKEIGSGAYFISSTSTKVSNSWRRFIDWYSSGIDRRATFQGHAFSLRCVRDN